MKNQALNSLPCGIVVINNTHRIVTATGALIRELAPGVIIGRSIYGFRKVLPIEVRQIETAQKDGDHQALVQRGDVIYESTYHWDAKEETISIIFMNVTERVQSDIANDLARSNIDRDKRLVAMAQTIAGISHEISNPLQVARGRIELMGLKLVDEDLDPAALIKDMQVLERTVDRMQSIVHAMSVSLRQDTLTTVKPLNLKKICEEALTLVHHRLPPASRCVVDIKDLDEDLLVQGRQPQLIQVIVNLVANAADAISEQTHSWIKLSSFDRGDGFIALRVEDSGNGIPPHLEEKIMLPFFTTKEIGEGTGLGLSICRDIISEHGGTLKIDREISPSCFSITLKKAQSLAASA